MTLPWVPLRRPKVLLLFLYVYFLLLKLTFLCLGKKDELLGDKQFKYLQRPATSHLTPKQHAENLKRVTVSTYIHIK